LLLRVAVQATSGLWQEAICSVNAETGLSKKVEQLSKRENVLIIPDTLQTGNFPIIASNDELTALRDCFNRFGDLNAHIPSSLCYPQIPSPGGENSTPQRQNNKWRKIPNRFAGKKIHFFL